MAHPIALREVLLGVAHREDRQAILGAELAERQVADLFEALATQFPFSNDPDYTTIEAHTVGQDEAARNWRDGTLRALQDRGTEESIRCLEELRRRLPSLRWLEWSVASARNQTARSRWKPPTPAGLRYLASDSRRRLVRDGR